MLLVYLQNKNDIFLKDRYLTQYDCLQSPKKFLILLSTLAPAHNLDYPKEAQTGLIRGRLYIRRSDIPHLQHGPHQNV